MPHPATCDPLETHDTAAAPLLIRFDGAARGNGKASGGAQCGIGFAAWHRDLEVYAFSQRVANGTNNEAEYAAVKAAADWALDRVRASPQEYSSVRIEGDSELVIKQLRGSYKVKAANLKPFHSRTSAAIELLRRTIPVTLGHVYRESNSRADALANEGCSKPASRAPRTAPTPAAPSQPLPPSVRTVAPLSALTLMASPLPSRPATRGHRLDTAPAPLLIRFDGAARGNGKASGAQCGIGFAAWHRDLEVYAFSQRVANGTNNEAEYAAVKAAADWALDRVRVNPQEYSSVRIEGDSELVIKQLRGVYKVKAANLKPFHSRTSAAIELLRRTIPVALGHVYRESNSRADALANEGCSKPASRAPRTAPTPAAPSQPLPPSVRTVAPLSALTLMPAASPLPSRPATRGPLDTAAAPLLIRFGGAARGNGKASGAQCGIGFAAWHRDLEVYAFSQRVANGTSKEAEYAAMKAAADWALDRVRASPQEYSSVRIEGDSELVIKQLRGSYTVKAANLKPFHSRTSAAIELLRRTIPVALGHVYRESNSRADALANEGCGKPVSRGPVAESSLI